MAPSRLYAEFADASLALAAARELHARGMTVRELHAPYAVPGADEVLDLPRPRAIPRAVAIGAALGAATAYAIQWFASTGRHALNVGGRPLDAVPAFVPVTFEIGVLFGALAAFGALVAAARLGRLWQPIFEVPGFERASIDRAWLVMDAAGDGEHERAALGAAGALAVVAPGEAS
jgi:hypothetical protein